MNSYYSTGDVSKKLNISLRTLRYYDQIGLVKPTAKNDSGKRYYSESDMLELEKIVMLKETSMALKDIKAILDQVTIKQVLTLHKQQLETNLQKQQLSLNHTNTLLNILKLEGHLYWDQLLPLFSKKEDKNNKKNRDELWSQLFKEEEEALLTSQLPKMEDDNEQILKWINVIKRIEICLKHDKGPDSEEGQLIAEDILFLSKETFNGNQQLANKFWEIRKSETGSSKAHLYPLNKAVITFIESAVNFLEGSEDKK
ncbi:MerR family transcriptional regulator [Salipaludibacillus sp. CUR1]|uniref:MerR family transcriptional regulator n=1 Tax=Salipaludibacillus sp. CUR1 TaxID=2820003 RepID=UPI001E3F3D89|nr:MerR family transcriptional regulator [Salipaludibacillus sp. CUR1]MCE7792951.1 MerR family transcriptional regulator [Salipaludibacillus sp. CUR1]